MTHVLIDSMYCANFHASEMRGIHAVRRTSPPEDEKNVHRQAYFWKETQYDWAGTRILSGACGETLTARQVATPDRQETLVRGIHAAGM